MRCAIRFPTPTEPLPSDSSMFRTIALTFLNEFRLLLRDRVGLFMLLLAPIVIIAVAGFSLGNIYGARVTANAYTIPWVDDDHGAASKAIVAAVDRDSAVTVIQVSTLSAARAVLRGRD